MAQLTIFIGTYTQSIGGMQANGSGIYSCQVDAATGQFSTAVLAQSCTNPSYLAFNNTNQCLYAVKETFADNPAAVSAMRVNNNATLSLLNSQPVAGELPCHIAVDPHKQLLASAQYWSGDICIYAIASDGTVQHVIHQIKHTGCGPDKNRQQGPHAHFVHFLSGENVLVTTDLGTDTIFFYPLISAGTTIELGQPQTLSAPPGAGPRHIAFTRDEQTAFVVNELHESIMVLKRGPERWQIIDTVQAFSRAQNEDGACAAIRLSPDERYVYVSGRRQSHIACFSFDHSNNKLERQSHIATAGEGPRDFALSSDGSLLVVANQNGNNLTSFFRNQSSGLLTPTGHSMAMGSPVCVQFVAL